MIYHTVQCVTTFFNFMLYRAKIIFFFRIDNFSYISFFLLIIIFHGPILFYVILISISIFVFMLFLRILIFQICHNRTIWPLRINNSLLRFFDNTAAM
ncbi:MAG TPA: hypothetical protein DCZ70_05380 [Alistipes sp.]|nr:hypothetical protein [Alistipes sp.]